MDRNRKMPLGDTRPASHRAKREDVVCDDSLRGFDRAGVVPALIGTSS